MPMDLVAEAAKGPAHQGKKKKNKKGTTLSLNDLLSTGPATPSLPGGPPGRGGGGGGGSDFAAPSLPVGPRASLGLDIDLSQLPPEPPYTAFLGNLPYEVEESDVVAFFREKGVKCSAVRIPRDQESDKIKGFGYAEFNTIPDLKSALEASGENLLNRRVRVDLAGSANMGRDDGGPREGGFRENSRADESNDWRMDRSAPPGGSSYEGSRGRYDGGGGSRGGDRGFSRADEGEWRRGPAEDFGRGGGGFDRGDRGGGFDRGGSRDDRREFGRGFGGGRGPPPPTRADDAGDWRRGDPVPDNDGPRGDRFERRNDRPDRGDRGFDRGGGREEREWRGRRGPPEEEHEWRRGEPLADPPAEQAQPQAPQERPKLKLAKRTTSEKINAPADAASSTIFGGAKPVDTAAKLAEVEAKIKEPTFKPKRKEDRKSGDGAPRKANESNEEENNENTQQEDGPVNAFAGLQVEDEDGDDE
eukprot:m.333575 g.333575  ORF g.333575 m.333575 type:complete len:473 (+) comp17175_c0_seq1:33-1451(+)